MQIGFLFVDVSSIQMEGKSTFIASFLNVIFFDISLLMSATILNFSDLEALRGKIVL